MNLLKEYFDPNSEFKNILYMTLASQTFFWITYVSTEFIIDLLNNKIIKEMTPEKKADYLSRIIANLHAVLSTILAFMCIFSTWYFEFITVLVMKVISYLMISASLKAQSFKLILFQLQLDISFMISKYVSSKCKIFMLKIQKGQINSLNTNISSPHLRNGWWNSIMLFRQLSCSCVSNFNPLNIKVGITDN